MMVWDLLILLVTDMARTDVLYFLAIPDRVSPRLTRWYTYIGGGEYVVLIISILERKIRTLSSGIFN